MKIYNNEWKYFEFIKKNLSEIIGEQGDLLIATNQIQKHVKKIKLKKSNKIEFYLKTTKNMLKDLNLSLFKNIAKLLYGEIYKIYSQIIQLNTSIRSIQIKAQNQSLFFNLDSQLKTMQDQCKAIFNLYNSISDEKVIEPENLIITELTFVDNTLQIFLSLHKEAPSLFKFEENSHENIQFEEIEQIQDIIKEVKFKLGYSGATLSDIIGSSSINMIEIFKGNKILLEEVLYYLYDRDILLFEGVNNNIKTKEIRQIHQKELDKTIISLLHIQVEHYSVEDEIVWKKGSALKQLSKTVINWIDYVERNALGEDKQNLARVKKVNVLLQNQRQDYMDFVENIEEYISLWEEMFEQFSFYSNNSNPTTSYSKTFQKLKERIIQKLDEFNQFANTLEEESHKEELAKSIDKKMESLKKLLQEYQENTLENFNKGMEEITKFVSENMKDYPEQIATNIEEMRHLFKKIQSEKGVNVSQEIDRWELELKKITQQYQFTFTKFTNRIIRSFEQGFAIEEEIRNILDKPIYNVVVPQLIGDVILPEQLKKEQLKKRIKRIESEKRNVKEIGIDLSKMKKYYEDILEKRYEQESGVKSKKCIICHQLIKISNDNFIKCEFCGSMSHYTCAVVWINKHNSCPVCQNSYTRPNNELFDLTPEDF